MDKNAVERMEFVALLCFMYYFRDLNIVHIYYYIQYNKTP